VAKAKEHYFDITAKFDFMEMKNVIEQVKKELTSRFDFKGVMVEIELNEKARVLILSSSSDSKIDALKDIVISKMIKRELSPKSLEEIRTDGISGGNIKVTYKIVDSIEKDEAKQIVKAIKDLKLKVTPSIQGDEVRVSSKKIDDLQRVIVEIKKLDLKASLSFGNFK